MITGLNHVGISVSNLDRAIAFYQGVLGMRLIVRRAFSGQLYDAILGLPGTHGNVAMLRLNNLAIELFEFHLPVPKPAGINRPVCDHGISHFCLEVSDIEHEYNRLTTAGVIFHCPPQSSGTARATYGRDPDGNVFELLQLL
jgi:catechol 2,3-dioxygenase-like lactoylglutathione lyase family enzyme